MVLEQEIVSLAEWLPPSLGLFMLVVIVLALLGALLGFLASAVKYGPAQALAQTWGMVARGIGELTQVSPRRVWAMARLAIQEAMRRRVLVVFAVFVVGLLFAGWFLDRASDNPVRLYLSFVLTATTYLVVLLAIFLSTFSLPNDLKNRTIYTVVTKPVRAWEIVLGRILGFSAVGTLLIALMGVFSYVFVVRGLDHRHEVDAGSLTTAADASPREGRTSFQAHHRHEFRLAAEGRGRTDTRMDHWHAVERGADGGTVVGPPEGMLVARVPRGGKLRFLDRSGKPATRGISVGSEWSYRSYVEGGTLAAAIWTFEGLTPEDFPDGLPLEMTIRVFRSYKGDVEQGILGTLVVVHPDPDRGVRSVPVNFTALEFGTDRRWIPRKLKSMAPDGSLRDVDLFDDLVKDGRVEIWVQCAERAQYFGMAQADVYLRAADRPFGWNFAKGYLSIWFQMVVVTCFGVMFSTFLSGAVAMMTTLASIVMGYFAQFVTGVATGQVEGGGPIESTVRLLTQMNVSLEMEKSLGTTLMKAVDAVLLAIMWAVSYVLPDYAKFSTTDFVASGFDISGSLMAQHALITLAYFVVVTAAGYLFFRSREIGA